MKKILVIEDEESLAEALRYTLGREGYSVEVAADGGAGLDRFERGDVDLVLLDLMLPVMDGLEVCRRIRAGSSVPIIMLTAKDSETDEVLGLELGADDYVTKPFNMRALIARVKAALRRSDTATAEETGRLERGALTLDVESHDAFLGGARLDLTPIEFKILEVLMQNPGKALQREYIVTRVWGEEGYGLEKSLDVHVRRLRKKIEEDPSQPAYVKTVRSIGFRFEGPGDEGGSR